MKTAIESCYSTSKFLLEIYGFIKKIGYHNLLTRYFKLEMYPIIYGHNENFTFLFLDNYIIKFFKHIDMSNVAHLI